MIGILERLQNLNCKFKLKCQSYYDRIDTYINVPCGLVEVNSIITNWVLKKQ